MLVTGGMNFQLEQHLDKEKLFGLNIGCSTMLHGKMRCKLGLLSLNQTILSAIQVSQLFKKKQNNYFNWRIMTLQYCDGFCPTLT